MHKYQWFREWGMLYRPLTWQGAVITILGALFLGNTFIAVDAQAYSVSDMLYGLFPYWAPATLAWLWIAEKTSGGK